GRTGVGLRSLLTQATPALVTPECCRREVFAGASDPSHSQPCPRLAALTRPPLDPPRVCVYPASPQPHPSPRSRSPDDPHTPSRNVRPADIRRVAGGNAGAGSRNPGRARGGG